MEINQIIGENLKKFRMEQQLTLDQLAKQSEISKGMISQIEKGETNPTINTIWKLSDGLNIPYTYLLEEQKQEATKIVRKGELTPQISEEGNYSLFCFYPDTQERNFELFQMELQANTSYTSIGHSRQSEEYILVLEGELTIDLDESSLILKPEEAAQFSATTQHTYKNTGEKLLKTIIINFYPN